MMLAGVKHTTLVQLDTVSHCTAHIKAVNLSLNAYLFSGRQVLE